MKISLIIPAYNEEAYIGRCLDSVFKNSGGIFSEIVVVNNGSVDGTKNLAKKYEGVAVVEESRKGANRARQTGFESTQGDVVVFLDADAQITPEWADSVVSEFKRNDKLISLSGPFYCKNFSLFQKFLIGFYWRALAMPCYFILGYMAVGGNFAVRIKALEQIGGFNTAIDFYGDDTNTARRLHEVGITKFKLSFSTFASDRRFRGQGFLKTGLLYGINFFSEAFLQKPLTTSHEDIR